METLSPGQPVRSWYQRRSTRGATLAAAAVGMILLAVGIFGFVSARSADGDSQSTKQQLAAVQAETADLQQQRNAAQADAAAALQAADQLDDARDAVTSAAIDVEVVYSDVVTASNAIVDCDDIVSDAAHVACSRTKLEAFQAARVTLIDAVAHLREEISKLEEGIQ